MANTPDTIGVDEVPTEDGREDKAPVLQGAPAAPEKPLERNVDIFAGATQYNIGLPRGIKSALSTVDQKLDNGDVVEVLRRGEDGKEEHIGFYTVGQGKEVVHEGKSSTYHTVAGGREKRDEFVGQNLVVRVVPRRRLLQGLPIPVQIGVERRAEEVAALAGKFAVLREKKYVTGPSWMAKYLGLPLCVGKVNTFEIGEIKLNIGGNVQCVVFVPAGGSLGFTRSLAEELNILPEFREANCIIEHGKLTI